MPEELRMQWKGKQWEALQAREREVDIEGAVRASKTTICLWREFNAAIEYPGIHIMLSRWTDNGLDGLLKPLWRTLCERAGISLEWHSDEQYDLMKNGSRIYMRGLKSQDQTLRYAKFRGLTLARVYVDQAEEMPRDIYLELAARLSQKDYPHQITISPQAVDENHWIAAEFPSANHLQNRRYISLSAQDNAHNLDPEVIPTLHRLYPPVHPKHKTLVLGQRGMNVVGEPVYGGAFNRAIHERAIDFNPDLPLDCAIDFGKHHPCIVFRQDTELGATHYLGGVFGQDMFLEDFLPIGLRFLKEWFGTPIEVRWCMDPAGSADNSQGVRMNGKRVLEQHGIKPRWVANSNAPDVRDEMIERHAAKMRKRISGGKEAFGINNDQFVRVSQNNIVEDKFLADGFEAGYVWDEHFVSVGSKQFRKAKKDGWYEHGQNAAEYLEHNFGSMPFRKRKVEERTVSAPPRRGDRAWMA